MDLTDKNIQKEANYILDCDDWHEHADIGLDLSEYDIERAHYPELCQQIQNTIEALARGRLGYQLAELGAQ